MEQRARFWQIVRPQDIVWIALFVVLAIYAPDRTPESTSFLLGLGLMQVAEPRIPFFGSRQGSIISFLIKLVLWYLLMGWTDGIASPYFWLMLLPVMSAATSLGLAGLVVSVVLACGSYLTMIWFLKPNQSPRLALSDSGRGNLSDRRLSHLRTARGESSGNAPGAACG